MKLFSLTSYCLLLTLSLLSSAQDTVPERANSESISSDRTIKIATYPDYEPFCFYKKGADKSIFNETIDLNDSSKIFTGLAWEVVLNSLQLQGYQVELFVVPWARAYNMLEKNEVDAVFPAIKTPTREQQFLFSKRTVYPPNPLVFYQSKNTPHQLNESFSNLHALKSGTIRGFSYGKEWNTLVLQQDLDPILFNSLKQGFDMLAANRFDVLPGYQLAHDYYLDTHGLHNAFKVSQPFDIAYSYLMFGTKNSLHLEHFNIGRLELQRSGNYQKLLQTWKVSH